MNLFTKLFAMTGQQTWELLAWTMCYFLVAGTAVALAGALLRFLCKRLAPQIRYTVSLAVFAILMALPFGIAIWLSPSMSIPVVPTSIVIDLADTPITMSPVEKPIEFTNIVIAEAQTPDAVPLVVAIARQNDTALVERLVDRAIELLPWLWLIGTPLTFLLLATGLIGSNRLRRKCKQLTEGPIFEACERLRTTLTVSQRVGIAINERIATPLLIGIVRPMILLPPAALTGWSPDELEMVLLHELAHVRRWDNLVNFGQRLVESLLFFHPAVWWVSRWVRRNREECCDAVVVARTEKPQAYAELLVALATPAPPLAGLALAQHPLAGRIRRILHLEEEKMLITRSTLGLVGFFVVAVLGIVLWQPTTATLAKESATEVAEQKDKDIATEDTESTEEKASRGVPASNQSLLKLLHKSPQGLMYQIQLPNELDRSDRFSAAKLEIWQETQLALIKSTFNLRKAIQSMINDKNTFPLPDVDWLQDNLEVEFQGELLRVRIKGKKHAGKNEKALSYYIETVMESYLQDLEVNQQQLKEQAQPSPFPTLEAQRAADLAYKLLHVELEPLNKDELARAKAMKFASGLRVASGKNLSVRRIRGGGPFHSGDLLVGLHVWPTTSLAEVKKVLERDDLQDLSPLKFYVIRGVPENNGGYGGEEYGAKSKTIDQLVTGRIEVNIDANKKSKGSVFGEEPFAPRSKVPAKPHALAPGDSVKVIVAGAYPDQPIDDVYVIEEMGTLALGPTYGRVKVVGLTLLEAEKKVQEKLKTILTDTAVQITLVNKAIFNILYDGKTFDQWRSQWKNELSIKNRTETVRAMAAFGNAGHGKEAAKVILEIAGQYDWMNFGDNESIQPFQEACCSAFGASELKGVAHPLPRKDAQEALFAEMHSENVRVRAFLTYVVPSYKPLIKIYQEHQEKDEELKKYMKQAGPFGGGGGEGGGVRY